MNNPGTGFRSVLSLVTLRLFALVAACAVIWHFAYPPGLLFYTVFGILFLSNAFLAVVAKESLQVTAKYLYVADGILLPLMATGAGSAATEIQIVFVVAILASTASAWIPAPLVSFLSGAAVFSVLELGSRAGYGFGSAAYYVNLFILFSISALGVYLSTVFRTSEKQIGSMREEIEKKESLIGGAADTISYWMNIYETAVHGIPSGIVLHDNKMRIVLVNDAFSRMIDEKPAELMSRTPSQYLPERMIGDLGLRKKLEHVLDAGEFVEPQEITLTTQQGDSKLLVFRAFPIYDKKGEINFVLAVFDDISELRKAHKELAESERQYRSLFMNIPDAVVVFSMANGSLLIHNQELEDLTGYSANELREKNFSDFFPEGDLQSVVREFIYKIGRDTRLSAPIELNMTISSAEELDVEVTFEPYFVGDEPLGIQAVIKDVTQRKTAEAEAVRRKVQTRLALKKMMEEKRIADELRKVDVMKSEFVSMASHELRTPMASIKGALSLLTDGSAGAVSKQQRKWIDMALKNVDRLTVLLNDTLDVAKIESGKFPLYPKEIDIGSLAQQVGSEYSVKAAQSGHTISVEKTKSPVRAYADAEALRRILINLVGNAISHTPEGSKISIRAHYRDKDKMPCIAVEDNGDGISPENLEKIFERFFQTERQVGEGAKGTGLGLAICKGLVEQMGGGIWVESEAGKGAAFYFTLPARPPQRN
jgi:PAS domain S-box-containing protein